MHYMTWGEGALTWKEGTGMCGPQDPLFTSLLLFTSPPVEAQIPSQDPHLKEKCNISPPKQTFFRKYDNFQLQKLKFDLFSVFDENLLTSPDFHGNLSTHKPPTFGNLGCTYLPEKKLSAPPYMTGYRFVLGRVEILNYFYLFQNSRGYIKKHCINTRLVCAHYNAFFMLNPMTTVKIRISKFFDNVGKFRPVVCTWHPCGEGYIVHRFDKSLFARKLLQPLLFCKFFWFEWQTYYFH